MNKRYALIVLVVLLVLIVSLIASRIFIFQSVKTASETIVVPDDYPTIQAALDSASDGDTVFVKKGTYNETLVINKSLLLMGESSQTTTIAASLIYTEWHLTPFPPTITVIQVTASNARISNFTINNPNLGGVGISIGANETQVIGNSVQGQAAIVVGSSHNRIIDNTVRGYYKGISCGGSYNEIINNSILASDQEGINLEGAFNVINGNILTGEETGIRVGSNSNTIINNILTSQGDGIQILGSNNSVSGNCISGAWHSGIATFSEGANNTIYGNYLTNNRCGFYIDAYDDNETNKSFYHNNIVNNTDQVFGYPISLTIFYLDNGKEGNYWSDYNGTDADGDGIGDTPYVGYANWTDRFPLMKPYGNLENLSFILPTLSPSPSALSPTPSPSIPEFQSWIILPLGAAVALLVTIFRKKEKGKGSRV